MDIKLFKELPLMGIIRGIRPDDTRPLLDTVMESGLRTIEVTMNTPGAPGIISKMRAASDDGINVGAGTVLSVDDLNRALDAGAGFIVMPCLVEDVMTGCVDAKIPVFPGALTPQEVMDAWQAGAAMVKIFPAGIMGPRYIKELKAPFDKTELIAVGGVQPDNVKEYFASGASAVAFGASVFRRKWIEDRDFASIGQLIKEYVREVEQATSDKN